MGALTTHALELQIWPGSIPQTRLPLCGLSLRQQPRFYGVLALSGEGSWGPRNI